MATKTAIHLVDQFTNFGDLLKYLRRRVGLTQRELSIAVGYSDAMICRLEQNQRQPDPATLQARFVAALDLQDEPRLVEHLLELAAAVRREDAPETGLPPFKGLHYFDEADSDLFFGREALSARLVARVMASLASSGTPRFLAVLGASGSGKSSLVRAGLIPALRWQAESADWPILVLTPTAHPLDALAAVLIADPGRDIQRSALAADLAQDPGTLQRHVLAWRDSFMPAAQGRVMLLILDQFEELFTLCRDQLERRAYVDNLLAAAVAPDGLAFLVLALRADFYEQCAVFPLLRAALAQQQEYIGAMTAEELRRAIDEPARRGGWEFESGLMELLESEVAGEPGALPLLSHALLETWQRRRGRVLTLSGYAASGGVRGAIAETAEAVFHDQLNEPQRAIARQIFLRLTEFGEDEAAPNTRRRVALEELIATPDSAAAVREVLTILADARLVTTERDTAEVAHEALLREWPTLRRWLAEDRDGLRLHRRLTEAAQDWERSGREASELHRGIRLAQALEWAGAHPKALNRLEQEFLGAGRALAEREAAEREAQRQQELAAARQVADAARKLAQAEQQRAAETGRTAAQLRRRAVYLAGALVAALAMAAAALFFGQQAQQSALTTERESQVAFSRELIAAAISNLGADPERSLLLALRAVSVTQSLGEPISPDTEDALHRALWALQPGQEGITASVPGGIDRVAFSPDGARLATNGTGDTGRIWDAATGRALVELVGHTAPVSAMAFSPDGRHIATASGDNTVRLWDATTGQLRLTLSQHDNRVNDVAFSRAGDRLASASDDRTVELWSLSFAADGTAVANLVSSQLNDGYVTAVAFSPDGTRLAVGRDDATVLIWEAATGQRTQWRGHTDGILAVAFSPDGTRLASASRDDTAVIWDVATGRPLATLTGHTGQVTAVAFSPDGQRLATASDDDSSRIWDAATGQELFTLPGSGAPLASLAFSGDGSRLAVGGLDGLHVFRMRPDDLITFARSRVRRAFTLAECQKYLHLSPVDCGPAQPTPTVPALPPAAARRICLLAEANRGDNPLTDLFYQGAQEATVRYGWESASLVPRTGTDVQTFFDRFLQSDCDLIFTSFYGYDATLAAAAGHPNQKFLMEDRLYDPPLGNVWAQAYATDQPAFLAGYLAAALSKTGKVATFGGLNYDSGVTDYMDGFALGVAYYDRRNGAKVQVLGWDVAKHAGLFVGDFCCQAQGYDFANQLMDQGADIILPVAGPEVGAGAATAIRTHAGRAMVGVDYDWVATDPTDAGIVLTSIEKRYDVNLLHAVEAIRDGSFTGGTHVGSLANGEVGLAPYHSFDAAVSPQLKADLDQIRSDIIAGKIATKTTIAGSPVTQSPAPTATTQAPP